MVYLLKNNGKLTDVAEPTSMCFYDKDYPKQNIVIKACASCDALFVDVNGFERHVCPICGGEKIYNMKLVKKEND